MQGTARRNPDIKRLEPRPAPGTPDLRGINHKLAELNRLDQQIKDFEEELKKLDSTDRASTVCGEVLVTIDSRPDALLPTTGGQENAAYKQWFEQTKESQGCGCCL